jgi:hypothetical protein
LKTKDIEPVEVGQIRQMFVGYMRRPKDTGGICSGDLIVILGIEQTNNKKGVGGKFVHCLNLTTGFQARTTYSAVSVGSELVAAAKDEA